MNTETKELLTLAAKAMGFKNPVWHEDGDGLRVELQEGGHCWWNPLNSADDMVEMECQQCLDLIQGNTTTVAQTGYPSHIVIAEHMSDHPSRRAARAMASLRVVAEIGRRMETRE